MDWKSIKRILFEYIPIGVKGLLTLLIVVSQITWLALLYFIVDMGSAFYAKIVKDEAQDLSDEKIDAIHASVAESKEDRDKQAREQREYFAEATAKQKSLTLLNKLLSEGLIREKDLLELTGTSGYYQLFVYSSSLTRQATRLGVDKENRRYPAFLEGLGFARLGKSSPFFIINKNNLKEQSLTDIREFKKFLIYHFSKIRSEEWEGFLEIVKKSDQAKYEKLKEQGYKERGVLKINFLITETNMNVTNIGLVDGDRIGLGAVTQSDKIDQQILEGSRIKSTRISSGLKIKIKRIIEKQDISLLLDGVTRKERDKIELHQDPIKTNLHIDTVLEFGTVAPSDLTKELKAIGLSKKKSEEVSLQIVSQAIAYKQALAELKINI